MITDRVVRHRVRLLALAVLTATIALILCAPKAGAQASGIKVGAQAPAAIVETLDGKQADLAQFVGKQPTLIEFWATWCSNCKQLEPAMHAAAAKYKGKVAFVGVAVSVNQSPERVKLYAEKHNLPLTVFYDRKGYASDAYDVAATSYIVVVNKAGKVVYTGLGGDQDIDAAIRKALQ
jgi:thiol-disulfide isomerase/thioredoxin